MNEPKLVVTVNVTITPRQLEFEILAQDFAALSQCYVQPFFETFKRPTNIFIWTHKSNFIYIVVTDMFRPLMWPFLGW